MTKIGEKKLGESLVLDVIDEKEMFVVAAFHLGRCQWRFGIEWRESQEEESFGQILTVRSVLADAQNDAVAFQLLFCKLQKREERLFARLVSELLGQRHVQHVGVVVQNGIPARRNLIGDM